MPTIGNSQLKLLEKLCNAVAVSGDEGEVRADRAGGDQGSAARHPGWMPWATCWQYAPARAKNACASWSPPTWTKSASCWSARMARVYSASRPSAAWMCASWSASRSGWARTHTPGVIGARPIHLTTAEERKRTIPLDALRIDIGPGGKASLGDRATFATKFQRSGPSIFAKALDNRFGVVSTDRTAEKCPAEYRPAGSLHRPGGDRLARRQGGGACPRPAAGHRPRFHARQRPAPLGWRGKHCLQHPSRTGSRHLHCRRQHPLRPAPGAPLFTGWREAEKIPYQFRQPGGGGTDAGTIHKARAGIPSLSISVPHRYTHTAVLLARLEDWKNTLNLLHAGLSSMQPGSAGQGPQVKRKYDHQ